MVFRSWKSLLFEKKPLLVCTIVVVKLGIWQYTSFKMVMYKVFEKPLILWNIIFISFIGVATGDI